MVHKREKNKVSYKTTDSQGSIRWYNEKGQIHKGDGPAIEWFDGAKFWCFEGRFHRIGGPAIDAVPRKEWYINGKADRLDGPAVEYMNEAKEWWVNGKRIK